jgi:muramidase (phage lysozyme)
MAAISAEDAGGAALVTFLDTIAYSEGTSTSPHSQNDGYDVIVTGVDGHHEFNDYSDHPFANGEPPIVIRNSTPPLMSTASGRYQLLARYWTVYKQQLGLPDFGPVSQDRVALQQIHERQATADILAGNIQSAIEKCSNIWASFPGNDYGQGGKTLEALLDRFQGQTATTTTTA